MKAGYSTYVRQRKKVQYPHLYISPFICHDPKSCVQFPLYVDVAGANMSKPLTLVGKIFCERCFVKLYIGSAQRDEELQCCLEVMFEGPQSYLVQLQAITVPEEEIASNATMQVSGFGSNRSEMSSDQALRDGSLYSMRILGRLENEVFEKTRGQSCVSPFDAGNFGTSEVSLNVLGIQDSGSEANCGNRHRVVVMWNDYPASEVTLRGSFSDPPWQRDVHMMKRGNKEFVLVLPVFSPPETIFFKFIVDGEWRCSMRYQQLTDSGGNTNNFMSLPVDQSHMLISYQ